MTNEDLIDTAPVIMSDRTRVLFESIDLPLNARGEIVLCPEQPFRKPTLFVVDKGSEVIVESIFHGQLALPHLTMRPAGVFRFGCHLDVTVTKEEPLKLVVINYGPEATNVGASLVDSPTEGESRYHLRREDLEE
jgi:hypothetical protein